jgi:hypothetical protein
LAAPSVDSTFFNCASNLLSAWAKIAAFSPLRALSSVTRDFCCRCVSRRCSVATSRHLSRSRRALATAVLSSSAASFSIAFGRQAISKLSSAWVQIFRASATVIRAMSAASFRSGRLKKIHVTWLSVSPAAGGDNLRSGEIAERRERRRPKIAGSSKRRLVGEKHQRRDRQERR